MASQGQERHQKVVVLLASESLERMAQSAATDMLVQNTTAVADDNRSRLPGFIHLHL